MQNNLHRSKYGLGQACAFIYLLPLNYPHDNVDFKNPKRVKKYFSSHIKTLTAKICQQHFLFASQFI